MLGIHDFDECPESYVTDLSRDIVALYFDVMFYKVLPFEGLIWDQPRWWYQARTIITDELNQIREYYRRKAEAESRAEARKREKHG